MCCGGSSKSCPSRSGMSGISTPFTKALTCGERSSSLTDQNSSPTFFACRITSLAPSRTMKFSRSPWNVPPLCLIISIRLRRLAPASGVTKALPSIAAIVPTSVVSSLWPGAMPSTVGILLQFAVSSRFARMSGLVITCAPRQQLSIAYLFFDIPVASAVTLEFECSIATFSSTLKQVVGCAVYLTSSSY